MSTQIVTPARRSSGGDAAGSVADVEAEHVGRSPFGDRHRRVGGLADARVAPSGHRAETERAIRIQLDVRVPSWVVLSAPDGQPIPGDGDRVVEDSAECQFYRILLWLASGRSRCGQPLKPANGSRMVAASSVRPHDAPSIVWASSSLRGALDLGGALRLEVLGVRLADVLHDQLGSSRFWPMPAGASTLDRTTPAHRPPSHSTATQFTEYPTPTEDRPAPISGQPDRHDRFRVPPSISDDLTATQTREYPASGQAAAASGAFRRWWSEAG
jgi:hypothetical protein